MSKRIDQHWAEVNKRIRYEKRCLSAVDDLKGPDDFNISRRHEGRRTLMAGEAARYVAYLDATLVKLRKAA